MLSMINYHIFVLHRKMDLIVIKAEFDCALSIFFV